MPERRKQRLSREKIIIINRNMFNNSKSISKVIAYMKKRVIFSLIPLEIRKSQEYTEQAFKNCTATMKALSVRIQ